MTHTHQIGVDEHKDCPTCHEAAKWNAAGAQRTCEDIQSSWANATEMGRIADEHSSLISQDGWEPDSERARR